MLLTYSGPVNVLWFEDVKENDGCCPTLKLQLFTLTLIPVKAQIPCEGYIKLFTL